MRNHFNTEQLRADADCREIARYIGMEVRGQFCQCPSGHPESQYNHCSINAKYYHCFSCNESGDVIKMVMEFYENILGQPVTLAEACKIIGDCLGGHEMYLERSTQTGPVDKPPFSKGEYQLLGFGNPEYKDGIKPIKLENLYFKEKDLYFRMIRQKAEERTEKINALLQQLGASSFEEQLRIEFLEQKKEIQKLYTKAGGTVQKEVSKKFQL